MTKAPSPIEEGPVLFEEKQYFHQWWFVLLLLVGTAFVWYGFFKQIVLGETWGSQRAPDWIVWVLALVVGVVMPWLFLTMGVITRVTASHLIVRFKPITTRHIPLAAIRAASALTYRPIREYGGWGIRVTRKRGMAYSCSGNQGVRITYPDGRLFLIGSQSPSDLLAAMQKARAEAGLEAIPEEGAAV